MSIENKAKELVKLHRREEKLQENLNKLRAEITDRKSSLNEAFEALGLDSNFS